MRIYISGPVTGTRDYEERFKVAELALKNKGHEPINPVSFCSLLPTTCTWDMYMKVDIALLSLCDAIYVMPGWEKSKGCKYEIIEAVQMGLKIYLYMMDVEEEKNEG